MNHFLPSCLKKLMGHSLHCAFSDGTFEIWIGHSHHGTFHPNHCINTIFMLPWCFWIHCYEDIMMLNTPPWTCAGSSRGALIGDSEEQLLLWSAHFPEFWADWVWSRGFGAWLLLAFDNCPSICKASALLSTCQAASRAWRVFILVFRIWAV